ENRRRVADRLGLPPPDEWCWLRQVHGARIVDAPASEAATAMPEAATEADGAVTTMVGVPLVVITADCAPLVLASDDAVGVVHAGWLGLLAGVVEAGVARIRAVGHGEVRAALGPCIRPPRYEFGAADLERL